MSAVDCNSNMVATSGLLAWPYVCTGALASIAQAQHEKEEQWLRSLLANLGEDEGAGNVLITANCIIIDNFLHLNRDWSPCFSTLRDKNGWVRAKTA